MMRWTQAGERREQVGKVPMRGGAGGQQATARRLLLGASTLVALRSLTACPQKPLPDPTPAPTPAPPPPRVTPPPPPPTPTPGPQDIVINQADLFGQFEARQGALVTIRALIVIVKNKP